MMSRDRLRERDSDGFLYFTFDHVKSSTNSKHHRIIISTIIAPSSSRSTPRQKIPKLLFSKKEKEKKKVTSGSHHQPQFVHPSGLQQIVNTTATATTIAIKSPSGCLNLSLSRCFDRLCQAKSKGFSSGRPQWSVHSLAICLTD